MIYHISMPHTPLEAGGSKPWHGCACAHWSCRTQEHRAVEPWRACPSSQSPGWAPSRRSSRLRSPLGWYTWAIMDWIRTYLFLTELKNKANSILAKWYMLENKNLDTCLPMVPVSPNDIAVRVGLTSSPSMHSQEAQQACAERLDLE